MSQPLTNERLAQIRATDEGVGPDVRFCPPAWLERRELLQHIAACEEVLTDHDRLVRELDVLLNGPDGAAQLPRLCDVVAQVRKWVVDGRIMTDEVIIQLRRQNMAQQTPTESDECQETTR